jgi:uncharacterized protein (TIGR02246 family)
VADSPHRAIVEQAYAAWNARDLEAFLATLDPNVVWEPSGVFPGIGDRYVGHSGVRRFWRAFYEPWESLEISQSEMRELGPDTILVHVHFRACGRDGIEVLRDFGQWYELRDGLLVRWRSWSTWEEALAAVGEQPG